MNVQTLTIEGAPAVRLQGPAGDAVTVLLRGAQVVSWTDAQGAERLYRSPHSPLAGPQAVRGGVPVIFPQFSERGPLVRHGFARTRLWALHSTNAWVPEPHVALQMHHTADETPLWPHDCTCTLTVALLPRGLRIALAVHNTGKHPLQFHGALHTYLEVGDITQATLTGVLPQHAALSLAQPIDHVFAAACGPFQLRSPAGLLDIHHSAFPDVVVWNPGPDTPLADLPPQGYARFVCVEAAAVAQPVALPAGAVWEGAQTLQCAATPAH